MALLLTNDDIRGRLDMDVLIHAMRQAFTELGQGRAAEVGRVDVLSPGKGDAVHGLKTMSGVAGGYAVTRIDSDLLRWPQRDGGVRREKLGPAEARIGKENGLLFLYSTSSGELLGIQQDGEIQRLRVAATSALALQLLGPPVGSIREVALLGTGFQAEAQLAGILATCRPQVVRVFSPRPERRRAFVERMRPSTGSDVTLAEAASASEAAASAQVVVCATNSMTPVVDPDWLRPGVHVSCIKKPEIDRPALGRCDRIVVTAHAKTRVVPAGVPEERWRHEEHADSWWQTAPLRWEDLPDLATVLADPAGARRYGRQRDDEVTAYVAGGSGVQFPAVCGLAHEAAVQAGLGRNLPEEWFLQDIVQE